MPLFDDKYIDDGCKKLDLRGMVIVSQKKILRRTIAFGLAFLLAASLDSSLASAQTRDQLQNKLDSIKVKQQSNRNALEASKEQLSENNEKQGSVADDITASENKIEKMTGQIAAKQDEVKQNQSDVSRLKLDIDKITERIKQRNKLLRGRLRSMYINGGAVNYLDVIMGSKSFGNFLDRLLALKMITDQDNKVISDQKRDKTAQLEKQKILKNKLEKTKQDLSSLEVLKDHLDQEKENQKKLLAQLKDQATEISDTVMDKNEEADILASQETVIKQQMSDLDKEEARKKAEEEKKKTAAAASTSGSSETASGSVSASKLSAKAAPSASADFIKPAAGYISSGYGYRSFDNGFHPGIDIANSTGTPIYAAADGVVFKAYRSSSYGNCIMISHNIGGHLFTTVYAHLSSMNVASGQSVSQGQVIGAMGSTGESSGPHLHFELYIGPWTPPPHHKGTVNPMNYIH